MHRMNRLLIDCISATRQAAALFLKNRVNRVYSLEHPRNEWHPISANDKQALKAAILPLIVASPPRLRTNLTPALRSMIAHDFPEQWPNLLETIRGLLTSSNVQEVLTGCLALLEIMKSFRYKHGSPVMSEVIEATFPTIVQLGLQLLSAPPAPLAPNSPEIPLMLHIILKTYKTTLVLQLSLHQQSSQSIVPWGRLLFAVVNLQIPADVVPEDEEERERCEWWKAKKWAFGTLDRLFHR
jgi:importin-7